MNNIPGYKMAFGRAGRTVDYADDQGNFTFVFDCKIDTNGKERTKGGKETLLLERVPLKNMGTWKDQTQADREHLAIMLARVKEYLCSLGYEVEVVEVA